MAGLRRLVVFLIFVHAFSQVSSRKLGEVGEPKICVKIENTEFSILASPESNFSLAIDDFRMDSLENTTTITVFDKCRFRMCGFSNDPLSPLRNGTCLEYKGNEPGKVFPVASLIRQMDFEVTTISCGCQPSVPIDNCDRATCLNRSQTVVWKDQECAIMFQEEQCQQCYFRSYTTRNNAGTSNYNTYQFRSMMVRPGCTLERRTNGHLGQKFENPPLIESYQDLVPAMPPAFYWDAETFLCRCGPDSDRTNPNPQPASSAYFRLDIAIFFCVALVAYYIIVFLLIMRPRKALEEETPEANNNNPLPDTSSYEPDWRNARYEDTGYMEQFDRP